MNTSKNNPMLLNCFSGKIQSFYFVKKEIYEKEVKNLFLSKQLSLDLENLIIFNITASSWLNKNLIYEENQFCLLKNDETSIIQDENKKKKKNNSILKKFIPFSKTKNKKNLANLENIKNEIFCLGVNFLEKNKFLDVFFSIGNCDIFFYVFELLFTNRIIENEMSHQIAAQTIELLTFMNLNLETNDMKNFLQNNGFRVLGFLLKQVIIEN